MIYLRMKQKVIKEFKTYSRMKNIVTELISISYFESALSKTDLDHYIFSHFVNDDIKNVATFEDLYNFLHDHYFLKLI